MWYGSECARHLGVSMDRRTPILVLVRLLVAEENDSCEGLGDRWGTSYRVVRGIESRVRSREVGGGQNMSEDEIIIGLATIIGFGVGAQWIGRPDRCSSPRPKRLGWGCVDLYPMQVGHRRIPTERIDDVKTGSVRSRTAPIPKEETRGDHHTGRENNRLARNLYLSPGGTSPHHRLLPANP